MNSWLYVHDIDIYFHVDPLNNLLDLFQYLPFSWRQKHVLLFREYKVPVTNMPYLVLEGPILF